MNFEIIDKIDLIDSCMNIVYIKSMLLYYLYDILTEYFYS